MPGRVSLDFMPCPATPKGDDVRRGQAAQGSRYELDGRNVVIVEDIVDTGLTLHLPAGILRARNPKHCGRRAS